MESMAARVTASLDRRKCFKLQTVIIVVYYYKRFARCSNFQISSYWMQGRIILIILICTSGNKYTYRNAFCQQFVLEEEWQIKCCIGNQLFL